jgi:hypothetical protein
MNHLKQGMVRPLLKVTKIDGKSIAYNFIKDDIKNVAK